MLIWTTSVEPLTAYSRTEYRTLSAPANPAFGASQSLAETTAATYVDLWSISSSTLFSEFGGDGAGVTVNSFRTIRGNTNSTETGTNFTFVTTLGTAASQTSAQTTFATTAQITTTVTAQTISYFATTTEVSFGGSQTTTSQTVAFTSQETTRLTQTSASTTLTRKTTATEGTHLNNVLAATIYEAEGNEVLYVADSSAITAMLMGPASEAATTATRTTIMPQTATSALPVVDLNANTTTTRIFTSEAETTTETFVFVLTAGTTNTTAVVFGPAIPPLTSSSVTFVESTSTSEQTTTVFASFAETNSYTEKEITETGRTLLTVGTHFRGSTFPTTYTDATTRTRLSQDGFVTSRTTSTSGEDQVFTFTTTSSIQTTASSFSSFDGSTFGETFTISSTTGVTSNQIFLGFSQIGTTENFQTIRSVQPNWLTTSRQLLPSRRSIAAKVGFRDEQDSVAERYIVNISSTLYVSGAFGAYPQASRSVRTIFPQTYLVSTGEAPEEGLFFPESLDEIGTLSVSRLSATLSSTTTSSFPNQVTFTSSGSRTLALSADGIPSIRVIDSANVAGAEHLGRYETVYQPFANAVYKIGDTTTRFSARQFETYDQTRPTSTYTDCSFFNTAFGSNANEQIIWTAPRNSTALPPA